MSFDLEDNMSIMEIFEKSQESIEIKESISNSSIPISSILIENYCDFIHISFARSQKNYSGWFIRDLDSCYEDDEDMEEIVIGETLYPHSETEETQMELYHEDIFNGTLSLLKYLFEIFTGPVLDFSFLNGTIPSQSISNFLVDLFRLQPIANCEKVMLYENGISSKNMADEVLELASGVKSLDFRCPLPDDWSNEKILKVNRLLAWPAKWFTTTDLLTKLDCEFVSINETNLKWQSFKAFMLKWIESNDTRLKILEISFDGNWEGFNTDGLEVKDYDPKERDSHYPDLMLGKSDWFNCEFVSDIQRADGLLASFWRKEHSFHFVVWHDRRPIATLKPEAWHLVKMDELEFVEDSEDEDEEEEDEEGE